MATYYVRKTGSNSNNGTSAGTAWLSPDKALGASGIASGDTVYVGAGVYREFVDVLMTSATVETQVIADVDGAHTGDAGEVRITGYSTDDKTAPGNNPTIHLEGKDHLTFKNFVFVGGNGSVGIVDARTVVSTDIKFLDCTFITAGTNVESIYMKTGTDGGSPTKGIPLNWTIDRCRFLCSHVTTIHITLPQQGAAYNSNVLIQNCLFLGHGEVEGSTGHGAVVVDSSGSDSALGGGIRVQNCTYIGTGNFVNTSNVDVTTYPVQVYNNIITAGDLRAANTGEISEDYNILFSGSRVHTNTGSNSQDGAYSMLIHIGQELAQGKYGRPLGTPTADSPYLGFSGTGTPTYDIMNAPRPAGGALAPVGSDIFTAVGAYEFGNSGIKETSTYVSSPSSLRILGPGWHDFDFPVDAVSTTISVQARFDGTYTGGKPQMFVRNGTEVGVADASTQMTVGVNTWEQISLNFTPNAKGIITIRLQSNTTTTTGIAYFDDFAVS